MTAMVRADRIVGIRETATVPALADVSNALARLSLAGVDETKKPDEERRLRRQRRDAGADESMTGSEIEAAVRAIAEADKLDDAGRQQLLGAVIEAELVWVREATNESPLVGDVVAVRERAIGDDGLAMIKIIQPGWGSSGFYCLGPDSRVLCADLLWRRVADLVLGDELVGFDESPADQRKRCYRRSIVEAAGRATLDSYEVVTPLGVTLASADHLWLVRHQSTKHKGYPHHVWRRTADLAAGELILAFGPTWEPDASWGGGYLAGLYDGEGHVEVGGNMAVSQRPGLVLERIADLLAERGFHPSYKAAGEGDVKSVRVLGGRSAAMHVLGSLRPPRLLSRSHLLWEGRGAFGRGHTLAMVLDVNPVGPAEVVTIGTSTKTLIADGLFSHNSRDVLERDGPNVFGPGTKMYWNHPTEVQERERPEGDLYDLAAEIVSTPHFSEGPDGPGLYAKAKVFDAFRSVVEDLAPHIGVSIRGAARTHEGEADGRNGPIIDAIVVGDSVDFVTMPGAGGRVTQLFEAAGRKPATKKEDDVTKELTERAEKAEREREEAITEAAREREARILLEAKDVVRDILAVTKDLPDATAKRLAEKLPTTAKAGDDGKFDRDGFKASVETAIKAELDYIAEITGAGKVRDMGSNGGGVKDETRTVSEEDAKKNAEKIEGNLVKLGASENAAKLAMNG